MGEVGRETRSPRATRALSTVGTGLWGSHYGVQFADCKALAADAMKLCSYKYKYPEATPRLPPMARNEKRTLEKTEV